MRFSWIFFEKYWTLWDFKSYLIQRYKESWLKMIETISDELQ